MAAQYRSNRCLAAALLLPLICCATAAQDAGKAPPPPPPPSPAVRLLDVLEFKTAESARTAWRAPRPGAVVTPMTVGGRPVLGMNCDFQDPTASWTAWRCPIEMDLTNVTAVVFDVCADNADALERCRIDLESGPGWYLSPKWSPRTGSAWRRVRIRKSEFRPYKSPSGWRKISAIRLLPKARQRRDATLYLANLGVEEYRSPALLLRQECGLEPNRQKQAQTYTDTMGALLEGAGIVAPMVAPGDLTPVVLKGRRLLILPYAVKLPAPATDAVVRFLTSGGKAIACHSIPTPPAEMLGVRRGRFQFERFQGEFSSMRFVDTPPAGVPARVNQASRAVITVEPIEGVGRVAAWWHSIDGKRTAAPAVVLSRHGAYLSYVIQSDDDDAKRALLRGLVSMLCPEIREAYGYSCTRRLAELGRVLEEFTWQGALARVRALPDFNDKADDALTRAQAQYADAQAKQAAGQYEAAFDTAGEAQASLVDAFCLAQRPLTPEFRATWCPAGEQVAGRYTWDEAAVVLADAGIGHVFLKALCGTCAGYPVQVFRDLGAQQDGTPDILAAAIRACAKHGIKVHVHTTSFHARLETAVVSEEFVKKLEAEGRLQVKADGGIVDSLCPSNEQNRAMLIDAIAETALKPGLAGIHLDYIRYPGPETCYCPGCRARFEQRIGRTLEDWPRPVLPGAPQHAQWAQFRRDNITCLVRDVRARLRRVAPGCTISAAVFKDYPRCADTVAQDWPVWIERGYLDFVCPMDYTAGHSEFDHLVGHQLALVGGRIPCYPGIGLLTGLGPVGAIDQIRITRKHRTGGFVLWSFRSQYAPVFPLLGKGITATR